MLGERERRNCITGNKRGFVVSSNVAFNISSSKKKYNSIFIKLVNGVRNKTKAN